jgi:SAM-dependent methyltransferase
VPENAGVPEMSTEWYARRFEKFLRHTDEKTVFAAELSGYLERHRPCSVLDIGAGDGMLAIPVAERVAKYVAVEHNPQYVAQLRAAGLEVVEGTFPVPLSGTYDLVLMSHVLSDDSADHAALVRPAWERVSPGGRLLVVTQQSAGDTDWNRLLTHIGMAGYDRYAAHQDELMALLHRLGPVEVREVTTNVVADDVSDLLEALAFVVPDLRPGRYREFLDHGSELIGLLDGEYRTGTGYSFPFQHLLVSVRNDR